MTSPRHQGTDVAALSAGIIAVAVTSMMTPGPYGGMGAMIAATLLILIIAYSWPGERTLAHSLAFAAVTALVATQLVAFGIELLNAPHWTDLLQGSDYGTAKDLAWRKAQLDACLSGHPAPGTPCPDGAFARNYQLERLTLDGKSRVNGAYLLASWIMLGIGMFAVDRGYVAPGRWWPNAVFAMQSRRPPADPG